MPNADHRVALPAGERQYHIGLGPGELAEYILLPGDPERTAKIARLLDNVELERQHREFASVTGTYRGQRVSIVSTGIGTDNVEIVVAEILAITLHPTFIRVGSCGGLQPEMALGDLVITTGAVRLETTTSWYVHDGYPAVADYEAVLALIEAAERLGKRYHVGVTATAPGFFGAQGRPIPQLPIRYPDFADDMARQRVMNFEMEASALLVLAGLARCRSRGPRRTQRKLPAWRRGSRASRSSPASTAASRRWRRTTGGRRWASSAPERLRARARSAAMELEEDLNPWLRPTASRTR